MKRILSKCLVLAFSFLPFTSTGQQAAALDSLRQAVGESKNTEEKIYWLEKYALAAMNVSPGTSDSLGKVLIELGEESRDRKLMIRVYLANGQRCGYFAGNLSRTRQSIAFYEKALSIARDNELEEEMGGAFLRLAGSYINLSDREKALDYANQAASMIATLKNDSLLAESQLVFGNVYLLRNEKILALRSYLNGLRMAEKLKNQWLMRSAYQSLSRFYASIDDHDKAIDYAVEAYRLLDHLQDKNVPYQRVIDLSGIGNLYSLSKNYDIAINYFQRSLAMADSLNFTSLKMPAYMSLFNQYIRRNQPASALSFFNSPDGKYVQSRLQSYGLQAIVDQAYGITYTAMGNFDSAKYHLLNAAPFFERSTNVSNKMYFYFNKAVLYKKMGLSDSSIYYFTRLKEMGEGTGNLENVQVAARELDSLYSARGDFKTSREFQYIYNLYKDSIETLGKEKELAQEEAADEYQRQLILREKQAEQARRRNNIQYLVITFGIFGLFLTLVILGMFKVSATLIRALGFFAFLLFFEFIFLIFKKNIYSITRGEPWKDLAFMIALAALLVPLHHYLEKKVLSYLTSHNRLTRAASGLRQRIFRRPGSQDS